MPPSNTTIDAKGLLEAFARLKGIPVQKVIHNAGKDFVQAALKATPLGKVLEKPFDVISVETGTRKKRLVAVKGKYGRNAGRFIIVPKGAKVGKGYKTKPFIIKRGWNRATWRGVMAALGMNQKNRPKKVPSIVDAMSGAAWSGTKEAPTLTISDQLALDKVYPGQIQQIVAAGYALATSRIVKEFNRIVSNAFRLNGTV